jgi:hypothetical protein
MSSEELQTLTASEPLSLEQEYEMQKTWAADEDSLVLQNPNSFENKYQYDHISFTECTFIILDKAKYEETNNEVGKSKNSSSTIQSTY